MTNTTLAQRIDTILSETHLTKVDFAHSLGVSANYISLLASGKKTVISKTLAMLIEQLYGYSTEWLLDGSYDNKYNSLQNKRNEAIHAIKSLNETELIAVKAFIKTIHEIETSKG